MRSLKIKRDDFTCNDLKGNLMSRFVRTPQDALDMAISRVFYHPRKGKPGEVIQSMPERERVLLRQLTSDHHLNHRFIGL